MKLSFTTLARLHGLSIVLAAMLMTADTPLITGYLVWSLFFWLFGYPLYFILGEPGRNDY